MVSEPLPNPTQHSSQIHSAELSMVPAVNMQQHALYTLSIFGFVMMVFATAWFSYLNLSNLVFVSVLAIFTVSITVVLAKKHYHKTLPHLFLASTFGFLGILVYSIENSAPLFLSAVLMPVLIFFLSGTLGRLIWGSICFILLVSFKVFTTSPIEFINDAANYALFAVIAAECFLLHRVYRHLNASKSEFMATLKRF